MSRRPYRRPGGGRWRRRTSAPPTSAVQASNGLVEADHVMPALRSSGTRCLHAVLERYEANGRRSCVGVREKEGEQVCLSRPLLRALSQLIEQHCRALSRGHLGARSPASGLVPPTAGGNSPFLTIALRPASGRLDIFITGRMRFLN
jgi:hypothetical protein